jgi:RNA polymerase sigma-70 factor (ECF subfamily)
MDRITREDEQELVRAFVAGRTPESYSALFRAMARRLISYFRMRGCDQSLAEDLTQEVMLAVYRQVGQLRDPESFLPWFYRIARNSLLQHFRHQGRQPQEAELADMPLPEGDPLASLQFVQWMQALDPDERELMRLRYIEGFEYHEISNMLRIHVVSIAVILVLVPAILVLREDLPDGRSIYLAIRLLQTADALLILASALAGVMLHRVSQEVEGGEMASALRYLVLYLILRPLTFVARVILANAAPSGFILVLVAFSGAAQWLLAIAIFYRWRLTQHLSELAKRYQVAAR